MDMTSAAFSKKQNPILTYEKFICSYNIKEKQRQIAKNWFPLYPSVELAEIAAALMTDGHIDWNDYDDSLPRPKKLLLYSGYRYECEWFSAKVRELFGVSGKVIRYRPTTGFSKKDSYKAIVYCAPLARVLISLGIPCGDKTQKNYLVPVWIMNGNKEMKRSFLKILFNFDGSISVRKNRSSAEINFCFNKHHRCLKTGKRFMSQIKCLLNEFNVSSGKIHIRKARYEKFPDYDKYMVMLFITNHKSIINFYKQIGFFNREKQGRLQKFIYKIYVNARVPFRSMPFLLNEVKEKIGSDKETVLEINKYSKIPFTYRQFEHMRRGELKIPIQMVLSAIKIVGKKEYFEKIPKHYQDVINIYDNSFLR